MRKSKPKILVVDDEKAIRKSIREILEFEDFEVMEAEDGQTGMELAVQGKFDIVLSDVKMPKMDGMELLKNIQEKSPETVFIVMSGHGTIETAVEAVKNGAYDYLAKPIDLNRLLVSVRNALDKNLLVQETKTLRKKIYKGTEIIGQSPAIVEVLSMINKVATTDARVLITGENGTGKELVARMIHERSKRSQGPLIEVNCAAIPSELIESELFGHEKGSFTSAIAQKKGKFELAEGGTLFLDEIGDMSLSAQAKVLRALQENKIQRVGGDKDIPVNVRVLAATNKDLKKEIEKGNFREDLYHRLSVIRIQVPPLRERIDDIPLLVEYFNHWICREMGITEKKFTPEAIQELQNLTWPGNVRELRNMIERLIILCSDTIDASDVKKHA
ncbi:MAG: sigma-54 dependent transcriptional regulator [Bacteroidia bacterium]|nr:sigma-54 dependent transcriptional regulator [Bacteroidia bacterium]